MGLILDTSALIGWLETQQPEFADMLIARAEEPVFVATMSIGELQRGVDASDTSEKCDHRSATLDFALTLDLITVSVATARWWGRLAHAVPRRFGHNDVWLLALAAEHGHTLVTQDDELARLGPDCARIFQRPTEILLIERASR